MKKLIFASTLISILLLNSCIKDKNTIADPNAKQHNEDASNIKGEYDANNNEINNYIQGIPVFGKNTGTLATEICGATYDTSELHDPIPTLYINFDGTTICPNPNRKRSGQIKVELTNGAHWSDAGAQLRLTYTNYKVTFVDLGNRYLTFNGVKILTDVNGINWLGVLLGTNTILLRERCNDMDVTFDNGQTAQWLSARTCEYGFIPSSSQIYVTVNGDTTVAGKVLDSWGVNRFGKSFTTEMQQAWKSNTTCGWWRPTQGIYKHVTDDFTFTATFGVNSSGTQVSSGCAYGFKLDWTLTGGSSGNAVISYW
jgi:hypothetical protein